MLLVIKMSVYILHDYMYYIFIYIYMYKNVYIYIYIYIYIYVYIILSKFEKCLKPIQKTEKEKVNLAT